MAWMLVIKCSCNLVPPSIVRTLLPTSLYPKDAPANHVPVIVHGAGNCLFPVANISVFGHEDATQISGIEWPLSYTDMFLDRAEQVVMPFLESK